ncbi:MAG: hypothetical protein ACJ0DG_08970 [bacterium]
MGFWKKPASDTQITHLDRLWLYVFAILIMFFLIIPTIIVVPMSFSDSQYLEFPLVAGHSAGITSIWIQQNGSARQ